METVYAVQPWHQETLIVPCPACGGTLVRSVFNPGVFDARREVVRCRTCDYRYDMPDGRPDTSERPRYGEAPWREVVGVEPGLDGEWVQLHLSCAHTLRLRRWTNPLVQRRVRCMQCRDLTEEAE